METLEIQKTLNVSKIKLVIKELVNHQRFLKNQRKTANIVGERQVPADEATYRAVDNSRKLRLMYAAYGLIRGKGYSITENNYPEENHPLNEYKYGIEKLVKEYTVYD